MEPEASQVNQGCGAPPGCRRLLSRSMLSSPTSRRNLLKTLLASLFRFPLHVIFVEFRWIILFLNGKQASPPNGYALFSTQVNPALKKEQTATMKKAGASGGQAPDAKIMATLAKYIWMKDNLEFRIRVIAALSLLIGAKVTTSKKSYFARYTCVSCVLETRCVMSYTSVGCV